MILIPPEICNSRRYDSFAILALSLISANLVLTQSVEQLFHPPSKSYAQTDRGVFIVRGENVVLLGEVVSFLSLSFTLTSRLIPGSSYIDRISTSKMHH